MQILEAAYKEPYAVAVLAAQSSEDEGEETVPGTRSVGVQTEFPIVRVAWPNDSLSNPF